MHKYRKNPRTHIREQGAYTFANKKALPCRPVAKTVYMNLINKRKVLPKLHMSTCSGRCMCISI